MPAPEETPAAAQQTRYRTGEPFRVRPVFFARTERKEVRKRRSKESKKEVCCKDAEGAEEIQKGIQNAGWASLC
jgi:hypothetical protein